MKVGRGSRFGWVCEDFFFKSKTSFTKFSDQTFLKKSPLANYTAVFCSVTQNPVFYLCFYSQRAWFILIFLRSGRFWLDLLLEKSFLLGFGLSQ